VVAHLYHLAQQKLRYEIVKNWLRYAPKTTIFWPQSCKFSSAAGSEGFAPRPPWPPAAGGEPPCWIFKTLLKWYIIAIRMEIIFCWCGVTEVILMVPHSLFRTIFQPVSHHQLRTENAVLHRCTMQKVVRKCPPLLATLLF